MTGTPRTYGGWRKRRPLGLAGLGPAGTALLLAGAVAVLASVTVSLRAAEIVAPPVIIAAAVCLIRVSGRPLGTWAWVLLRWHTAAARDRTSFRSGTASARPGAASMPGVLAATSLVTAEDGTGGRYGLVLDRHTGFLTATVTVTPAGPWLADPGTADQWVAGWGAWLASLGYVQAVRWVSVTVETAPEPGTRLADAAAAQLSPDAPEAARQIIAAVIAAAPRTAAQVATRISLTIDPSRDPSRPRDLQGACAVVTRCLRGLLPGLSGCGMAVSAPATAEEIAGWCRAAFDPAARGEVGRVLAARREGRDVPGLSWADAGPVGAQEMTDRYLHDSGISVSWAWQEAPRHNVTSTVLARLAAPGPFTKRLTLQYRVMPASEAVRAIQSEVEATLFRKAYKERTGRDSTARDAADAARAAQAASEEAAGAGVALASMIVTVDVTDPSDLDQARADVREAAGAAGIRLRVLHHSQSAGFAAGLPAGVCLAEIARRRPR